MLPLKAVVLDNDETTGSYSLVFAILLCLDHHKVHDMKLVAEVLQRLAVWMNVHHCFRPGLRQLLQSLVTLRYYGKLDAIIMYTNQSEVIPEGWSDPYPPFLKSPPQAIAFMMNCLTGHKVFDHILSRPKNTPPTPSGHFTKTFERILDLYPTRPRDIRDIVFVDDLAYQPLLTATTVALGRREHLSWYLVEPYHRPLIHKEIIHCIESCCKHIPHYSKLIEPICTYMAINQRPFTTSLPNAKVFQLLQRYVQKKFLQLPVR